MPWISGNALKCQSMGLAPNQIVAVSVNMSMGGIQWAIIRTSRRAFNEW